MHHSIEHLKSLEREAARLERRGIAARGNTASETRKHFFFNDSATTEIYTLSLHDALPICSERSVQTAAVGFRVHSGWAAVVVLRSEEHTSELQSLAYLVCRLLLEKKN